MPARDPLIRDARVEDIPAIQRVARDAWTFTYERTIPDSVRERALESWYSHTALARQIAAQPPLFLVAEESAGVAIGFAQLRATPPRAELTRIYVTPARHGEGIGTLLLDEGVARLLGLGARTLAVSVERDNTIGRQFYERRGFSLQRETTVRVFGHDLHHVVYDVPLLRRTSES